jgi:bacterioferritin-associated ferredoxin
VYVCICQGVTESQIRDAIHDGAESVAALAVELGIGAQCGTCVFAAECLLEEVREELGERHSRPSLTLVSSNRR